jgi:hypothetical protein|tara:strand:+ start:15786 stop:15989 length:204 start_codon:yes stop_codon:yes gene_type:complete
MAIIAAKANAGKDIQNGTILVQGPKGDPANAPYSPNTIETYATVVPSTGTINARYGTAFTGCPPCLS